MLKFFRQYNKYILSIGVALLMVAFLIQPTLSMFGPSPGNRAIGTIHGQEITLLDQRQAANTLQLLQEVSPVLIQLASGDPRERINAMLWLLIIHDAQSMGLSASQLQVDQLLSTLGIEQDQLAQVARQSGVSVKVIRQALQDWIIAQAYKELAFGLGHKSVQDKVAHLIAAGQFFQFRYFQGMAMELEAAYKGSPRLSTPAIKHFLHDHQSRVQIAAVAIPDDAYLAKMDEPDEAALTELFERYKDALPGQGEPHGLGYRLPDRVKIEYLTVPLAVIKKQVRVEEADALDYYDTHTDEFRPAPPANSQGEDATAEQQPEPKPYAQVRGRIIKTLTDQQAAKLSDQIIKTAQAILLEDARGLTQRNGYRAIPDGWSPIVLDDVAQRIKEQFEIDLVVRRYVDDWVTRPNLAQLPGIGHARLTGQNPVAFVPYVMSAKEILAQDTANPLISLRLQTLLPSAPLVAPNGDRCLFRLTAAEASHIPESMDQARPQVLEDAKRLAAYQQLQDDAQTWLDRAKSETMETLASHLNVELLKPQPFQKRQSDFATGVQVPRIEGIGRHQAFVDGVFEQVDRILEAASTPSDDPQGKSEPIDIKSLPAAQRIATVAIDREMKLFVVRIDGIEPMSQGDFERIVSTPQIGAWFNQSLTGGENLNPLSMESLSDRVGFVPAEDDEEEQDEPAEPASPADNQEKPAAG